MASSFPGGLDTSFPGWPYDDYTEYVTAEQANAWIAAIQAIEATIGYGTTTSSPLYSSAYSKYFTTLAARISNVETTVTGAFKLNTASANIQPVGSAASAGSTGLAADAGHVHAALTVAGLLPIGSIIMWPMASGTFPSGYLACNGQLISTGTYAALYALYGTAFGSGSGTFGVPNFNDRFPIGVDAIAPSPGATGGSANISVANMPAHNHGTTEPNSGLGHNHQSFIDEVGNSDQFIYTTNVASTFSVPTTGYAGPGALSVSYSPSPGGQLHTAKAAAAISINSAGSGSQFVPPYIGVYFLVRAL